MGNGRYNALKELKVYQLSRKLSALAWQISKLRHEHKKIIGNQFIRSADFVGSNIAKGYARYHYMNKVRFYHYSRAFFLSKICVVFILILLGPTNHQGFTQSLQAYLDSAAINNPSLKAKYKTFEAATKRAAQVSSLPEPKLSFGYFISPIETRVGAQQAKLSLSQTFPWFGTLKAKKHAAALEAEASYQYFLDRKNQLFLEVKQAYYPLFEINKLILLQEENIKILNSFKKLTLASFSNGKASMTDVLQTELTIEEAETKFQILKEKIKPQTVKLNRLLNRPDSLPIIIGITDSSLAETHIKPLNLDSLFAQHPKIKQLEKKSAFYETQQDLSQKESMPSFGIGLDYAFITERTDMDVPNNGRNAIMPMVTMSLPIYRKKYSAKIEENQLLKAATQHQIEGIENSFFTDYEAITFEMEKSIRLHKLYQSQIKKTEQILDLLYSEYSNSGNGFDEILRTQQHLVNYKKFRVSNLVKYHLALARLDYLSSNH